MIFSGIMISMDIYLKPKLDDLGVELETLGEEIAKDLVAAVAQTAQLTYNKAVEMSSERLNTTRQQYIDALNLEEEGEGIYTIYLEPEANHLEEGYPAFPMLPKLATGPASKVAKDGSRYTIIPIRQRTTTSESASPEKKDIVNKLNQLVADRKFKKVRTTVDQKTGKKTTVERLSGKAPHRHLQGLTRVREYASAESQKPTSSAYITFRVASTKQNPGQKWRHPGFEGANIFPDLERWADSEIDKIVQSIFGR